MLNGQRRARNPGDRRTSLRRRQRLRRQRIAVAFVVGVGGLMLAIIVALVLVGGRGRPTGQVEARINGREITVADLEAEARAQGLALSSATRQTLLRAVLARELLAQEAEKRRLGRLPGAPADLERARRQAQARWFLDAASVLPSAGPAQIDAYMRAHPDAFAARRTFDVDELATNLPGLVANPAETIEAVQAHLPTPLRITSRRRVRVSSSSSPRALVRALDQGVASGDLVIWREGPNSVVLKVLDVEPDPLEGPTAAAEAARDLVTDARAQQLSITLRRLRTRAHLELNIKDQHVFD